jgi:hypothetical protein
MHNPDRYRFGLLRRLLKIGRIITVLLRIITLRPVIILESVIGNVHTV